MNKLLSLSLVVLLIGTAFTPVFATVNQDTQMFDLFTLQYVDIPQGTVVIVYESRWGGSQYWYLCNTYVDGWFYRGWLPASVLEFGE